MLAPVLTPMARLLRRRRQRSELDRILAALYGAGEQGIAVPDLTPGNGFLFQDSAGTTPVTAYEQPVGLILDRSKGLVLGSQLNQDPGFNNPSYWTAGSGWVVNGGVATATASNAGISVASGSVLTIGRWYQATVTVTITSGSVYLPYDGTGGNLVLVSVSGTYTRRFLAAATGFFAGFGVNFTGLIDNVTVQELPGNHLIQTTSTKRPTLSARYNLLQRTENFSASEWVKERVTVSGNTITATSAGAYAGLESSALPFVVGTSYTLRFSLIAGTKTLARIWFGGGANVSTATRIISGPGSISAAGSNSSNIANLSPTVATIAEIVWTEQIGSHIIKFYPGDWASQASGDSIVLSFPDVRRTIDTIGMPAYQRVGAINDYDTAGFFPYLAFDGTDDSMATAASVDFTGTNKMTVFAGISRENSSLSMLLELGSGNQDGSFYIAAPYDSTNRYGIGARGNTNNLLRTTQSPNAPPAIDVVSAQINNDAATIANQAALRVNAGNPAMIDISGPTTSANFSNYSLFLGARSSSALFFKGKIYPFFIRGAATDATTIAQVEQYIRNRMPVASF